MFLQNVISVYCMFHFKRIQHYSNTLLKNKTVYKTVAHTEQYKTTQSLVKDIEQRLHKLIYLQDRMKLKYMRCVCSIQAFSVKALRHWSVAWYFILKLRTGSRPAPAAAPS